MTEDIEKVCENCKWIRQIQDWPFPSCCHYKHKPDMIWVEAGHTCESWEINHD